MPTWVAALSDATKAMDPDARLVYYELLFVQWSEHGVLPNDVEELQRLARLTEWPAERFGAAWGLIQGGNGQKAKFVADRHGLYNARGRTEYRKSLERIVKSHRGLLAQHGCPECRELGRRIDLDDGWVRRCPRCGVDLWLRFPQVLWLPKVYPPEPKKARVVMPVEAPVDAEAEQYALAVEEAWIHICGRARTLGQSEGALILEWQAQGVPLGIVLDAIEELSHRAGRRPATLVYFRPIIAERFATHQRVAATAAPVAVQDGEPQRSSTTWSSILERLEERLSLDEVDTWLRPLVVASESRREVVLSAPNASFLHLVASQYGAAIELAAGDGPTVRLTLASGQ
jgi:hypothetical protein